MTESVARVKILAQIEGLEGFDKLKGAFKGLQQAIGPTDQQLEKARRDIIAFGEAGKRTEQIIRGQVDALKALKSQAGTGGQLYTTLGADIRRLEGEVRDLSAAYVDLANNKSYTEKQLRTLLPATSKPGMLSAQVDLMQADLARMQLLTKEYMAQIAKINNATTEGRRKQTTTDLFGAALSGNQYLNSANFFDAPAAFEKQANAGVLPRTVAAKQAEISQIKEQLQNVLRDAGNLEPLLNDIRRIETRLATQSTSTGGTRTTIGGLESVGRELGTDWQKARITLGQLTTEYDRLKRAQQDQVRVLETQLLEAEEDLQRMLNGTTKESEQLTRAEERRARVAEKLAQIQQDASKAPGVGGYRDPETGAMLARGNESTRQARENLLAQIQQPVREISALYQSIGAVGISKIANDVERMGNSYQEVTRDIRAAKAASDGSINSLQAQRSAWEALRNSVDANGREFKEATRELAALDRQLERTQPGNLRGKIGYIGQGVGAIASAGIFGGPEGAIGGALGGGIGAALGGPAGFAAGSFIGSSIGAYAGMFRQNIAAAGEFAAEVKKLEIALRGVVGTAEEYARAQQVIKLAGAELNVPVLEATKGFTQLTAAVKGAGGGVKESEVVFRGVTEAIKATGGGAEEVQGALTAMAQIFSKGKVSAEELQGQLGERLPGAVTLFAQATGRTLPQLQKDLEQGVVGLNDVIKFATSLSDKYGEQAAKMAASTEDSTARMKVALDDLKVAFGGIVKPITASIQTIIAKLAEMAVRALRAVGLVKDGMSELGAVGRAKDLQSRASDAYAALGSGNQSYNEKKEALRRAEALANSVLPQKSLVGLQQNVRALQQARDVVRRISADGLDKRQTDLLLNYGKALDNRIAKEQQLLDLQKKKRDSELKQFEEPGGKKGDLDRKALEKAERDAQQVAAEQQRLAEAGAQAQLQLSEAIFRAQTDFDRKRFELQQELINKERELRIAALTGVAAETASATAQFFRSIDELRQRTREAAVEAASAQRSLQGAQFMSSVTSSSAGSSALSIGGFSSQQLSAATAAASKFTGIANMCSESVKAFYKSLGISLPGVTAWADTVRKAGTVMRDWSKLQPGDIVATGRPGDTPHVGVYTGGNNVFHQSRKRGLTAGNYPDLDYFKSGYFVRPSAMGGKLPTGQAAQLRRNVADQGDVAVAQVDLDTAIKYKALLEEMVQKRLPQEVQLYALAGARAYSEQSQALRDNVAELQKRQELELSGARQEVIDSELKKFQLTRDNSRQVEELRYELTQKEALEDPAKAEGIRARIAAVTQGYNDQKTAIEELTRAQIAFNDSLRFRQDFRIGEGLKEGAQSYVESIGTMRQATAELAQNGIKGVEEALFSLATTGTANFRAFAADILKQTARMIIQQLVLRTIMQAIGAIGGGGGGAAGGGALANFNAASAFYNANGNAFGPQGVIPYAMGGIVTRPTLFKFANGGYMNTGLMGEAGPEAIIPLKRGRDGKLGVSGGGNSTNVTVNVDASGSSVQGNAGQGEALGRAISQAVQQELIKQRRPGGLLAA